MAAARRPGRGSEGVVVRHRRGCQSRSGGSCSCLPTYQAQAYSPREGRTIRKTFPSLAEARAWRQETQVAAGREVDVGDAELRDRVAHFTMTAGQRDALPTFRLTARDGELVHELTARPRGGVEVRAPEPWFADTEGGRWARAAARASLDQGPADRAVRSARRDCRRRCPRSLRGLDGHRASARPRRARARARRAAGADLDARSARHGRGP